MSSAASPRPSVSASSRRTSTSTDTTTTHAAPADRASLRRNRAALRDYYGLKSVGPADVRDTPPATSLDVERESELDKPGFNPSTYVTKLLANEGAEGVLKVEAGLVSEIRNLDGEKKALVYDNYSKLIAATDTTKNMREKMDPLTPATSTLTPAIGHIAETAASLSSGLKMSHMSPAEVDVEVQQKKREQQVIVRWVLGAPSRLHSLVENEQTDEAKREWEEVKSYLEKWCGVQGMGVVHQACVRALTGSD